MRARVIDAQHAGVMLSQYGRLDQSFDAAMPSLVEVLQEEGLYNNDSEMVTHVVAQALQQVSSKSVTALRTIAHARPLDPLVVRSLLRIAV